MCYLQMKELILKRLESYIKFQINTTFHNFTELLNTLKILG